MVVNQEQVPDPLHSTESTEPIVIPESAQLLKDEYESIVYLPSSTQTDYHSEAIYIYDKCNNYEVVKKVFMLTVILNYYHVM